MSASQKMRAPILSFPDLVCEFLHDRDHILSALSGDAMSLIDHSRGLLTKPIGCRQRHLLFFVLPLQNRMAALISCCLINPISLSIAFTDGRQNIV